MRPATVMLAAAVVLAVSPTWADFQAGLDAYKRGDYATALREFRQLAEQGLAKAQYWLGITYDQGRQVPQDYVEAFKWFQQAADQGHAGAQYRLGLMYHKGKGMEKDYVHAHLWYNLAAGQGNESGLLAREEVAKWMTPAQVAEAHHLAREWKPK